MAWRGAGARVAQRGGASSGTSPPRLRRCLARCRVAGLRPAPSTSPSEAPKHHITRRLRLLPCLASDACMLPRGHRATAAVSGAFAAEYGRLGRSRWGPGVQNPKCPKTSNYGVGSGFQLFLGHFGSVEILTPGGAWHRQRARGNGQGATATVSGAFFAKYGRLGRSRRGPGVQSPKCPKTGG